MGNNIFEAITIIVKCMLDGYGLTDLIYGKVMSTSPLEIRVSQRAVLKGEQLCLPQTLTCKEVNLAHSHKDGDAIGLSEPVEVREGLAEGDEVMLLKVHRGHKFIVLGKSAGK